MKKTLIILTLMSGLCMHISAQSLYNKVHETATDIVSKKAQYSTAEVQISQFKLDALNYITGEVAKRNLTKDGYFYDSQAVSMNAFLEEYKDNTAKAAKISAAKKAEVEECYRKACQLSPLFGDTDTAAISVYVNKPSSPTPFPLDTDWEKAYDMASLKVKKLMK